METSARPQPSAPPQPPPHAAMMQMINGKLVSRCISEVAELAIADHLADGPRTAAELAGVTGADADALHRVLRTLAALGVFEEREGGRFANSALSDTLRGDAPGSVRAYARWLGTGFHWRAFAEMGHTVRTGKSAVLKDEADGTGVFDVLDRDAEARARFDEAMTGLSLADAAAIVEACDFSRFGRIVDVGGGHGALAASIARAAPDAEVVVFDLPETVEAAGRRIEEQGLEGRLRAVGGSFFEEVPGPADACVLKHIIHDWDDDAARTILRKCRQALTEDGRVVVCEMLVTPGPESIPARVLDIEMLVGPGGRERTEEEFRGLFRSAGLRLERVLPTPSPIRVLEAAPEA